MDIVEYANARVCELLVDNSKCTRTPSLVRKHSDDLAVVGDFSFPLKWQIWRNHLSLPVDYSVSELHFCLIALSENRSPENSQVLDECKRKSASWQIPLERLRIADDRGFLYLARSQAIRLALKSVSNGNFLSNLKNNSNNINFKFVLSNGCKSGDDLNAYRAALVKSVLEKLVSHSSELKEGADILVIVRSQKEKSEARNEEHKAKCITISCGNVIDEDKKVSKLTASEYKRSDILMVLIKCFEKGRNKGGSKLIDVSKSYQPIRFISIVMKIMEILIDLYIWIDFLINIMRAKDMQLMAMHKYGVRVQNEDIFRRLINHLGEAAVKVDLLESKHTSPVAVRRNGQGCTKGASFILYNSARIETLLRTFEDRVKNNLYPSLPELDLIDITYLNEEEEWKLIFNYILGFPNVIKQCLEGLAEGKCAPHILVQFLCCLVGEFSVYYRRVRVLLDGRNHLIPVVQARIYLVKCIREILNDILAILGIDPIERM